ALADRSRQEADIGAAVANHLVERRESLLVGIDVGALVDQERAEFEVPVLRRERERAGAVRQRIVDAGAGLDQSAAGLELPELDREQQRTERRTTRAGWSGCAGGARKDAAAGRRSRAGGGRSAFAGCPGLDVGTGLDEHLD